MTQLEDHAAPKRCGHLRDKVLIPVGEMVGKLRAASEGSVIVSKP